MRGTIAICLILLSGQAIAGSVISARAIRANAVLTPEDVTLSSRIISGALSDPASVVGMEATVAIYPGRPIRPQDVRQQAVIERNEIISLIFQRGGLLIQTEGRALGRGAAGDRLRVMNLASRKTVSGQIRADGSVVVE